MEVIRKEMNRIFPYYVETLSKKDTDTETINMSSMSDILYQQNKKINFGIFNKCLTGGLNSNGVWKFC